MNKSVKIFLWILAFVVLGVAAVFIYDYYQIPKQQEPDVSRVVTDSEPAGIPEFYLTDTEITTTLVDEYVKSWRIHFLDVGQGDAILIQGNGQNILVDGGDKGSGIVQHLTRLLIDTIHWVIATHPHADHIAGLVPVLRTFPVLNVMDPGVSHSSALYRTYRSLVDSATTSYTRGFAGWSHSFTTDFEMQVLHPDTLGSYNLNDVSLVVRMKMGETYALFTGDAEHPAERAMLKRGEILTSHIIKVGHHGSKTSSCTDFLQAVNPEMAFISCGLDNKYKFPHAEAITGLQQIGTRLFQSDIHGNILILVNEKGYSVFPEKSGEVQFVETSTTIKIDINTADLQSLIQIIHIGETTARAIIANRPFASIDDLARVRGIGPGRLADIKAQGLAGVGM
jgi:competence protein ComEC